MWQGSHDPFVGIKGVEWVPHLDQCKSPCDKANHPHYNVGNYYCLSTLKFYHNNIVHLGVSRRYAEDFIHHYINVWHV